VSAEEAAEFSRGNDKVTRGWQFKWNEKRYCDKRKKNYIRQRKMRDKIRENDVEKNYNKDLENI